MGSKSERGFPSKCVCGRRVTMFTSATQENPGRPFFWCETKKVEHLFKWVEEAVLEEVEDALPKFRIIENEVRSVRLEMEEMKGMIQNLIEDGVFVKVKLRMWKFITKCVLVCMFLMRFAIVYLLF